MADVKIHYHGFGGGGAWKFRVKGSFGHSHALVTRTLSSQGMAALAICMHCLGDVRVHFVPKVVRFKNVRPRRKWLERSLAMAPLHLRGLGFRV